MLFLSGTAIFLILSSLDLINKYFGVKGMAIYSVAIFFIVFLGDKYGLSIFVSLVSERSANYLAALMFAVLAIFSIVLYRVANAGTFGGGSDADEALILAVHELVRGRYPFYPYTYLGNPIAPMPGSVILAIPFVIAGLLPLQNVAWLAAFFVLVKKHLKSSTFALALLSLILLVSPVVLQNLATGTDRTSNTIYILAAMWLVIRYLRSDGKLTWQSVLAAIFLGIGLSSRSNFFFVTPIFFAFVVQNGSWSSAVKLSLIAGLSFLLVTLPFWLYDPAGFTPFTTQAGKLAQYEYILPYARIIVPVSGMLLAIALSFRKMGTDGIGFLWNCAFVQMFSVFLLTLLASIHAGHPDLYFGHVSYGVFFLFFGTFAAWIRIKQDHDQLTGSTPD